MNIIDKIANEWNHLCENLVDAMMAVHGRVATQTHLHSVRVASLGQRTEGSVILIIIIIYSSLHQHTQIYQSYRCLLVDSVQSIVNASV